MSIADPLSEETWLEFEREISSFAELEFDSAERLHYMERTAAGLTKSLRDYQQALIENSSLWKVAPDTMSQLKGDIDKLVQRSFEHRQAFSLSAKLLASIVKLVEACRTESSEEMLEILHRYQKQLVKSFGRSVATAAWHSLPQELRTSFETGSELFTDHDYLALCARCNQLIVDEFAAGYTQECVDRIAEALFTEEEWRHMQEGVAALGRDIQREILRRLKNCKVLRDFLDSQRELYGEECVGQVVDQLSEPEYDELFTGDVTISSRQMDRFVGECNRLCLKGLHDAYGESELERTGKEIFGPSGWREVARGKRPLTRTVRNELTERLRARAKSKL